MFRGSVKSTGYPLHSPVSPSLPPLCVTVCHHISTGVYIWGSSTGRKRKYFSIKRSAQPYGQHSPYVMLTEDFSLRAEVAGA